MAEQSFDKKPAADESNPTALPKVSDKQGVYDAADLKKILDDILNRARPLSTGGIRPYFGIDKPLREVFDIKTNDPRLMGSDGE